ncbi:MAG: nitroreductase/quinone reductase family protein [Mycobacterium sp.]|uniref:nitroreductase/quinone reductase family protein n=1 Tax=Mycobacterium sp. TaxID=1785 RepID=UPI00389A0D1E
MRRRAVDALHQIANPIARRLSSQVVLETTGRVSGRPRHTPIGGLLDGETFWFVSMHGDSSNYTRNIKADNNVRVRIGGRWRTGRAHLLPDDDARARNAQLSWVNRTANSGLGTELLTIRIDLDRQ